MHNIKCRGEPKRNRTEIQRADNLREILEKGNDVRDDVRVHRDGERDEEPLHIRRDARGDIRIHGIQPQVDRSAHDGARDGVRDEHVQEETPSANLAHPLVLKHVHQEVRGTTAKVVNTHRGGNKVRADQNGCGGRQAVRKLLRLSHFAEEVGIDALSTVRKQNAREALHGIQERRACGNSAGNDGSWSWCVLDDRCDAESKGGKDCDCRDDRKA
mmetsp:Transcript_1463/g.3158  ORF Transcript_1463/g.3158 Transcript_1463/m.3158 type:complete len:215 (+) Transcript_1463:1354-1998(+)